MLCNQLLILLVMSCAFVVALCYKRHAGGGLGKSLPLIEGVQISRLKEVRNVLGFILSSQCFVS